ncbi:hypothetical protein IC63_09970 [Paracoccus sphaerophysae]|uniref:BrnA antitoxin of type II toxin-antitoxin system n=2 Tax=Paracoccus sphaerophysae TaxID=690417 RepID=A0A099F9W0_9RHOB|nr:hypothetical protein IC63_09970 [Paracoccus sphaerophysae]
MAQGKAEAARRVNYHYMADVMRRLEWDLHQKILTEGRVPDAWHELARERGSGKRVRVTLMVEEEVLRFFRSLGEGYGPRMNRVLAGFMHARLAGVLEGGETMDYFARRREAELDGPKPGWGATQKPYEEIGPETPELMSDEPGVPFESERSARLRDMAAWVKVRE